MSMEAVLRKSLEHLEDAKNELIEAEVNRVMLVRGYEHLLEDEAYRELFTTYARSTARGISLILTAIEKIMREITTGDEE